MVNQDQEKDLRELRRMLVVPTERDFPVGRRIQREEHLMNSWPLMSRRNKLRTGGTGQTAGETPAHPLRRAMTRKRLVMGVVAAAIAGTVLAIVPDSSSNPAYAVEKNDDGTLTVSMHDLDWQGGNDQWPELVSKIRAAGFKAVWDKIPAGKTCELNTPRGAHLPQQRIRDRSGKWTYQYTMTHKDAFLVVEYLSGPVDSTMDGQPVSSAHAWTTQFVKGPLAPCKLQSQPAVHLRLPAGVTPTSQGRTPTDSNG